MVETRVFAAELKTLFVELAVVAAALKKKENERT